LLGWPLTALAALGAWTAWRRRADPLHSLVLVSMVVMLVPPLVGFADAAPHFLRSLGLAAPLAALIGLGCAEAIRLAGQGPAPERGRLAAAALALLLALAAAGSGAAYFNRPVSQRYEAYAFNLVQLSQVLRQASPGTQVVLDVYRSTDLVFLNPEAFEREDGPELIDPATPRPELTRGAVCDVLGLSRADISAVYGNDFAAHATPAAFDPWGRPSVWQARCQGR
jgi:hypothetical protein